MAKQNRGKALGRLASRGRGTCPVCYRTRTKLLYQRKNADGTSISVCKKCTSTSAEVLNSIKPLQAPIAFRRRHRKVFNLYANQQKEKESS